MKQRHFRTADIAFRCLYQSISKTGIDTNIGTRKLMNIGFYIDEPAKNYINCEFRKWNPKYAFREWQWYLSQNRSVEEIKKFAPIWDRMHNGDNIVNSNYGYLWNESDQLEKTIAQLEKDPDTRKASITIFDGKNKDQFEYDTPCTLTISFCIEDNKLCMTVLMRSNDLWFGFCNDQYCFSRLQWYVAKRLKLKMGWYYHHAIDLHIYNDQLNKS